MESVPKYLAERPIKTPGNSFWNVFKRLGRDEFLALLINVIGTSIIGLFTSVKIILSLTGPIIEKIGFFPANFWESYKIYKTTPKEKRKKYSFYTKKAFKTSATSLTEDILVHDPIYIILMYVGLQIYSETPIWILSATSFILAVILVSVLEVIIIETKYLFFKKRLKNKGFDVETYYESRFLIKSDKNPKELIEKIKEQFNLFDEGKLIYHDTYFENKFPEFCGRLPKVRLRKRTYKDDWMKTLQIIYTKPTENQEKPEDQYRFFPIKKEKIYFVLNQKMPKKIDEIEDQQVKKCKKKIGKEIGKINFERYFVKDNNLLAIVDKIDGKRDFHVLEIKVRKDLDILLKAMRYVMQEFSVLQTTHGKSKVSIN